MARTTLRLASPVAALMVAALAGGFILAIVLMFGANWPETCQPSGVRWTLLFSMLRCSSHLLHGGLKELALFAVLWLDVLLTLVVLGFLLWKRFSNPHIQIKPE